MHPIAFHLGSLTIRSYGVMMALAFVAGLWTATRRARLANIPADTITDVTAWLLVSSIIGARVDYVTTYWKREFADQPFSEVFMVQHGGLVFYGGLIGAIIGSMTYLIWKKLPVWKIADILAPSIALGSVFGRIGCLLNGCCYGRECSLPWAITFTNPQAQELSGTPLNVPLHPTEIYDGLLNLILYIVLAWLFRSAWKTRMEEWGWKIAEGKKVKPQSLVFRFLSSIADGQIFAFYLIGYAICRSIVECFRGDYPPDHIHDGLFTSAQLVSAPILIAGIVLAVVLYKRAKMAATPA